MDDTRGYLLHKSGMEEIWFGSAVLSVFSLVDVKWKTINKHTHTHSIVQYIAPSINIHFVFIFYTQCTHNDTTELHTAHTGLVVCLYERDAHNHHNVMHKTNPKHRPNTLWCKCFRLSVTIAFVALHIWNHSE